MNCSHCNKEHNVQTADLDQIIMMGTIFGELTELFCNKLCLQEWVNNVQTDG